MRKGLASAKSHLHIKDQNNGLQIKRNTWLLGKQNMQTTSTKVTPIILRTPLRDQ